MFPIASGPDIRHESHMYVTVMALNWKTTIFKASLDNLTSLCGTQECLTEDLKNVVDVGNTLK